MNEQLNLFQNAKKKWDSEVQTSNNRQYNFETVSGESVDLLYHPDSDDKNYLSKLGFPGQFPFTRGLHSNLYRGKLWTMRQYAGVPSAAESNKRYRYLIDQCVSGLSIAFDLPFVKIS